MIRFPHQGVVRASSTALWRCSWAVVLAALVASGLTLKHRDRAVDPCAAWLQQHAGQTHSAGSGQVPVACPCLNTPPPLMSPEEAHAMQVQAAADNAMLKGLTRINEAAIEAAKPVEEELNKLDVKEVEEMAKEAFEGAEKNQTESLKLMLSAEEARQEQQMSDMQKGADMVAKLSADHVRQTAEEYAKNQARNQIFYNANGPMAEAIQKTQMTEAIRQEAVELTKGTIKSAANSLDVAKKAQAAIAMVPKDAMSKATAASRKSKKEQKVLNKEIEGVEDSVREIARVAEQGYDMALRTLDEAKAAELTAREALKTSRGNALKIEKLKARATRVGVRAKKAAAKSA